MFALLEAELQKELLEFCKAEENNTEPKPLKEILIAEVLRKIAKGQREITGMATNEETGDVFIRLSFTQ